MTFISWAGNKPELVLEGLFGGPSGAERLHYFTGLPAASAVVGFALECLFGPEVIPDGDKNDKQASLLCEALAGSSPKRVADVGAGAGRVLSSLVAAMGATWVRDNVDYYACDSSTEHRATCIDAIAQVWESADERYLGAPNQAKMPEKAHVVLLCNVLHEIHPRDWIEYFGPGGVIDRLLDPSGFVLIAEDYGLPTGERAHDHLFFLLHGEALQLLFAADGDTIKTASNGERIQVHRVPASALANITAETRRAAITAVHEYALEKVADVRKREPSYQNGLRHALFSQLFANAALWLAEKDGHADGQ